MIIINFIQFYSLKMKGLEILIVSLLISLVNSDQNIERSNHIQRFASKVSDSSESGEDNNQCKDGSGSSSTGNPKILVDIFLPSELIRYMEVSKVDVMVYNKMSSKDPVDVEVSIPNDADNSKFQFFNNKSDKKDEPELTKTISVPFDSSPYISFWIKIKDIVEINEVMYITIKASVKSENYECYLTQSVKVKPPGVKVYHNSEKTFNLIPTRHPILMRVTPYNPNNSNKIEDLRTSVKITGHRNKFNKIDFSVTLPNEYDSDEDVHVTTEDDPIEVMFPKYRKNAIASIKGTGLCTIKVITERTVLVKKLNPKFNLNMTRLPSLKDESIVRICATYDSKLNDLKTLSNVIYYVEMQCGFVFKEAIEKSQKPAIKVMVSFINDVTKKDFFKPSPTSLSQDFHTKNFLL